MRQILAVRQDNNGDVTLAGPALRALARHGSVTLVCAPTGAGAAALLPDVDALIVARAEWIAGEPRPVDRDAIAAYVADIARRRFDDALIFTSFHQSPLPAALLLRLAGVPRIHAISTDYPGSLLDTRVRIDDADERHEVERALTLVRAAGFATVDGDDALRYRALPDVRARVPAAYVAVQPGATVPARAWSPARYRETVRALESRGYVPVLLGSAAERELCASIGGGTTIDLSGQTTFAEFAAVIAGADAVVAGNSAGIHVAAAVGTPVVSIFPPTIPPARFRPWRVRAEMLGVHDIACRGCRARSCPIPGQPCIGDVRASDVLDALQRLGVQPAAVPA